MKDPVRTIKRIRLSEKASLSQEKHNAYVLEVEPKATKIEIRQAVEKMFDVKAVSVNTCRYDGKARRQRRSDAGTTAAWKKAVVTLKDGDTIEFV